MDINKNKKICIVGVGKHSYTNLMPLLKKMNFKIVGLVSRSPKLYNRHFKRYISLNLAIKHLPKDTIYLISSPPRTHYPILKKLLINNKNVLVEKPLVVNLYEVFQLHKLNLKSKNFFYEMFMYKFTSCYKKLINFYRDNINDIKLIELTFLLPSYPKSSFRDGISLEDSCLFDIGSYVFDLSMELGNKIENLKILNTSFEENRLVRIQFNFQINSINLLADIGLHTEYKNYIKVIKKDQSYIIFDKIFYGKKTVKEIQISPSKNIFYYADNNGYEKMFNQIRAKKIFKDKLIYYIKIKKIYEIFNQIKKKIDN